MLRRGFRVGGAIQQARIYATSLGVYELQLNGRRVGDQLFTPGWTSYNKRLQYQTYDVTSLLRAGENVVGAILGDGWYRGNLGFDGQRNAAVLVLPRVSLHAYRSSARVGSSQRGHTAQVT